MERKANEEKPRKIESVNKACRIIQELYELQGANLTELADRLDLTPGTVYPHLTTLKDNEFIYKKNGEYEISYRLLEIGDTTRRNTDIYKYGKEKMEKIDSRDDIRTHICKEEAGMAVCIAIGQEGSDIDPPLQLGNRTYLHGLAAGKAILANLPRNRVDDIINKHGLPESTEKTITDEDTLMKELEDISEQGYATNDEESTLGLRGVAAAIKNSEEKVQGAIAAYGPKEALPEDRFNNNLSSHVSSVANTIELNMRIGSDEST